MVRSAANYPANVGKFFSVCSVVTLRREMCFLSCGVVCVLCSSGSSDAVCGRYEWSHQP